MMVVKKKSTLLFSTYWFGSTSHCSTVFNFFYTLPIIIDFIVMFSFKFYVRFVSENEIFLLLISFVNLPPPAPSPCAHHCGHRCTYEQVQSVKNYADSMIISPLHRYRVGTLYWIFIKSKTNICLNYWDFSFYSKIIFYINCFAGIGNLSVHSSVYPVKVTLFGTYRIQPKVRGYAIKQISM